ncbi:MFS family permease [Actinoplanes octamycinicus]|uniref:MFS family permease n=1 Tax=Actinoplanes octamycinicus TaxID=135948 RepID=A0A7W7GWC3_9ACTN|nr:MFS transporter [Actinoplanes octamycinicus]MBB4739509.1 MFS family permease [Actinoplanes octamycinicus]GIE54691.1 MFS transporter [Actinoplanes octamycinicus]
MLLYPVYALLFADAGLTTGQISSLFAIWSIVAFSCEIPAGALADTWSRKRVYALGELLTAAGFGCWLLWPGYPGFAAGFVLWGLGGALSSGTLEALSYDALGDAAAYARLTGHAGTVGLLAMLAATLLAAPAYAAGGYHLVGTISIATVTAGGLLALRLPDKPLPGTPSAPDPPATPEPPAAPVRTALRLIRGDRAVARALLVAALVPGFSALDEYLPLLARDKGAPTAAVPLLFALTALAMAAGSAVAARRPVRPPTRPLLLAATLLATGALLPHLAGMVPVAAAFGLLQYAMVHAGTGLQEVIPSAARTTVLSVSGFAAELCAVLLYAGFALPVPLGWLFAVAALPLIATARLAARRSPAG